MRSVFLLTGILVCITSLASAQVHVGRLDTIGGTTYDWQVSWGAKRTLVSSRSGLHAVWVFSAERSNTVFPDRNARYNLYDYRTREWAWIDPDYMFSGQNLATSRIGFGNVDVDDTTGGLAFCGTAFPHPFITRTGGSCQGPEGYTWPLMAVGDNGTYHLALSPSPPDAGVWYSRVRSWCAWDPPIQLGQLDVPAYSIAASQVSPAVCVVWADGYGNAIYRQSEDRGDAWSELTQLEAPVAFGGDTVTELSLFGLFPFFDSQGRLHVAAALYPVVRETAYTNPAELWHWCPTNQPNWTRIHRAGCRPEHQQAGIGYNALYAGRPSLGQAADGRLYVAWEQFDSTNVEPQTNLLRAGIWVSGSADNGVSWRPGLLVTERNRFSHRFPCIVDRLIPGGPSGDTLGILYMADSVAGFFVYAQGPGTHNPVLCQFVPGSALGIQRTSSAEVRTPNPGPTIVRGVLNLEAYSRQHTAYRAELLDASGRRVLDLHPGANDVSRLAPGVYFVRAVAHESSVGGCRKVVIAR